MREYKFNGHMENTTIRRWILYGEFYIIFKTFVGTGIRCIICLQFTHEERRKIMNTGDLSQPRVSVHTKTAASLV
jgi:hypothetical protein